jgi:phage tail tape-measure protein
MTNTRRCIAAITGGAIAGAMTGAAIGSVVPIIGNIVCGIIGAFSGALASWGTASPCDEKEDDDD